MDSQLVMKILMTWGLDNEDYEIILNLYRDYRVGIPAKYIYKFPTKKTFSSVSSFLSDHNTCSTDDNDHLARLLILFKESKWCKLGEWNNSYGYRLG